IPVEVKGTWSQKVAQASTYARCLFAASPTRSFVPVFVINHKSKQMRFLICHRSG
ncbi:hypothetical protein AMATHDRAFT_131381, partial [Amanita thiersii Skay4041]